MSNWRGTDDYFAAVTRFVFVCDEPAPADVILVPGSSHEAHVLLAAEMYRRGLAPLVVPSGAHPKGAEGFTGAPGYASEAAWMTGLLTRCGVPREAILAEERATFTWENALFSRRLLEERGIHPARALLCVRPFHARRALTYYAVAFPDTAFRVIPASEPGLNPDDWHRTPQGLSRVMGEVCKLGSQVAGEVTGGSDEW